MPASATVNKTNGNSASIIDMAIWLLITQPFFLLKRRAAAIKQAGHMWNGGRIGMAERFHN
ncbi:hypothetical protein [Leisingera sp. S232]|uniref:hypothetical protein n=1 Tax=Leisingera sp. S232 TaxID=3415132 RepID=UPI003C7D030D